MSGWMGRLGLSPGMPLLLTAGSKSLRGCLTSAAGDLSWLRRWIILGSTFGGAGVSILALLRGALRIACCSAGLLGFALWTWGMGRWIGRFATIRGSRCASA